MMTSCRDNWSAWSDNTERSLVTFSFRESVSFSSAAILEDSAGPDALCFIDFVILLSIGSNISRGLLTENILHNITESAAAES